MSTAQKVSLKIIKNKIKRTLTLLTVLRLSPIAYKKEIRELEQKLERYRGKYKELRGGWLMPYCFTCGKEIYLIQRYMKIQDCICENCKASFSVLEKGQVNEKEMDRAYREYQKNYYLAMKPGLTYKQVVNRMLAQKAYSGKMYHPNQRNREPWSTLVAEIIK